MPDRGPAPRRPNGAHRCRTVPWVCPITALASRRPLADPDEPACLGGRKAQFSGSRARKGTCNEPGFVPRSESQARSSRSRLHSHSRRLHSRKRRVAQHAGAPPWLGQWWSSFDGKWRSPWCSWKPPPSRRSKRRPCIRRASAVRVLQCHSVSIANTQMTQGAHITTKKTHAHARTHAHMHARG